MSSTHYTVEVSNGRIDWTRKAETISGVATADGQFSKVLDKLQAEWPVIESWTCTVYHDAEWLPPEGPIKRLGRYLFG